jgi:hypothetical protein
MSGLFDTDDAGGFAKASRDKKPKWDEKIQWFALPDDGNPYTYRLVGNPVFFFNHWVTTKKKDGTMGKAVPFLCKNYNSVTSKWEDNGCKFCEVERSLREVYTQQKLPYASWPKNVQQLGAKQTMAINMIVRDLQLQGPPGNVADWSYVHPVKLPKGVAGTIVELAEKYNKKPNPAKDEVPFWGMNHTQYGMDISLSYNSNAPSADKTYMVVPMGKTPLTDAEKTHATPFMVDFAKYMVYADHEEAIQMLTRNGYYDLEQTLKASAALGAMMPPTATQAAPVPKSEPTGVQAVAPSVAPQQQTIQQAPAVAPAPAPVPVPTFDANEQFPDTLMGAAPVATPAPTPAPIVQAPVVAAAPPVQQPVAPAPAPVAQPATVAPVAAPANTVAGSTIPNLDAFVATHGKVLKMNTEDYPDTPLKYVKPNVAVPTCFSLYTDTRKVQPDGCKACPIKLDCMQVG